MPGALWSDSPDRGLYSTTDGGKKWKLVLKGSNLSTGCSDHRDRSERSECDVRRDVGFSAQRLDVPFRWRRSEHTFGERIVSLQRWRRDLERDYPGEQQGFSEETIWPTRGGDRTIELEAGLRFVESTDSALFVSDDGGSTWDKRDKSQWMVWRPFYFANLIVDPKNPDRVFKTDGALILSEDAGKSFATVGGFGGMHGDVHDVWIDPTNPQTVFSGDDGGIWYSYNSGSKWWKGENLPISQFYHVSVDDDDPYRVYGGLQDNSCWVGDSQYPGGITNSRWENIFNGDGFCTFPDPSRSRLHLCRIPGRLHRAGKSPHSRSARHSAQAELQGKAALELEYADGAFA